MCENIPSFKKDQQALWRITLATNGEFILRINSVNVYTSKNKNSETSKGLLSSLNMTATHKSNRL